MDRDNRVDETPYNSHLCVVLGTVRLITFYILIPPDIFTSQKYSHCAVRIGCLYLPVMHNDRPTRVYYFNIRLNKPPSSCN